MEHALDREPPLEPVVIRLGRMGDTLLLQPLLARLRERYGKPCCLLAEGSWPRPMYAADPAVGEILQLSNPRQPLLLSPQRWLAIAALRHKRHAPFYVCEPEPRPVQKIRRLLGFAGIPTENCVFLSASTGAVTHWADRLLQFGEQTPPAFQAIDSLSSPPAATPRFCLTEQDHVDARAWRATRLPGAGPLLLIQPSNKRTMRWNGVRAQADDDKAWPLECWGTLLKRIADARPNLQILLCGTQAERRHLQAIRDAASSPASVTVVAGELPLRRLAAVLAQAESMISVDTGPAHIAAAVDCPLVVMYGKADPRQWLPRSLSAPVLALGGPPSRHRVDSIPVDEVFVAWLSLPRSPQ